MKRFSSLLFMLMSCIVWTSAQSDVTTLYLTNPEMISTDGWTQNHSVDFWALDNGLIGSCSVANGKTSTTDATHLATEYCFGIQCRWSTNFASFTQTTSILPVGEYTLTFDVENTNSSTTKVTYDNLFFVQIGDTKFTDNKTEWMNGSSSWTTHTIRFNVYEVGKAIINLGYGMGNNNYSTNNTPHLYVSHLKLTLVKWVNCTEYIQNPGFDDDISFNKDGTAAKTAEYTWVFNDEGWCAVVSVSSDGSIYSQGNNSTTPNNKYGIPRWYGHKANIKGWETTNKSDTAIWIYYGSLPYDLEDGTMMLGNDEEWSKSVPEKPAEIATPENTGVLYLKSGWLNECSYKQTVRNLEKAKYRLSYYIRNTNAAKSSLYDEATNLCNVTCNGVTFVDDEGFNSEGWILHTIDFIPVDSFSIEFGCKSTENYSYNNPILWIDGIRLYKMAEAADEDVDSAYQELVEKAKALLDKIHFAGDRRTLQDALQTFVENKDYVALYQAIQMALTSEDKYLEITADDALIHAVDIALSADPSSFSSDAKEIVSFAFTKISEWIVSDIATYHDADDYVAKVDAYTNLYVPVYMEAEKVVSSIEKVYTERLRALMESHMISLTDDAMLEVDIVKEYIEALQDAMNDLNNSKKCSAPVITYEKGVLAFTCDTEGVEFMSRITDSDISEYNQSEIELTLTYNISVYAHRYGYEDSDVSTATLLWIEKESEGDEATDNITIPATPVLIQGNEEAVSVIGAEDGMKVAAYKVDGSLIGSAFSNNGIAIIHSNLQKGNVVIVKAGSKAVKIVIR